jgi:parallel beta-helix repeat protein
MGARNVVRYNTIWGNRDTAEYDGNGIEVDRWCDDNEVYYNVIYGNDGAGIIVFNGARNRVFNNTVFGNGLDSGKTHAGRVEIAVVGDEGATLEGNVVRNNVAVATAPGAVALKVKAAAARGQQLGSNLFFNSAGGAVYDWAGKKGSDAAEWNARAGARPADLFADPRFADPATLPDGLRLAAGSPAIARGERLGLARDRAGRPLPADRPPSLGAYETAP